MTARELLRCAAGYYIRPENQATDISEFDPFRDPDCVSIDAFPVLVAVASACPGKKRNLHSLEVASE